MKNAYETLGVPPESTIDDIKKAYRRLSTKWHPDVNKDPDAPRTFAEISEAYAILSDPTKRAELDSRISQGLVENIAETAGRVVDAYLDSLHPKT